MRVVIYQYTEPPLVLEHVTRILEEVEGDVIEVRDSVEGRLEFRSDDIMKFEGGMDDVSGNN